MPAKKKTEKGVAPTVDQELLQKMLAIQLHGTGATQDAISRIVGRRKEWVNQLLRGLPKRDKRS